MAADQVVTLRLTADAAGVVTGAQLAGKAVASIGPAGEAAGRQVASGMDKGTRAAAGLAGTVRGAVGVVKQLAVAAVAAAGIGGLAATLGASVGAARDFQAGMAEVSTLLSDTSGVDKMAGSVRGLAKEYGQAPVAQAKALYQIISAGISDTARATATLEASNRLALGGITDVATAADGLTTVLNAYGPAVGSAGDVSDRLFVTMRAGKTTIGELAAGIGTVAPIAAQTGVALEELLAGAAALTLGGVKTSTALDGIRATIAAIIKPSQEATELAAGLGLQFDAQALKAQGLAAFLDNVKQATGGSAEQMAVLFGGVEALAPVMALTGNQAGAFKNTLESLGQAAGATDDAVEKMAGTAQQQFARLQASVGDSLLSIGENILQVLAPAAQMLADNWDAVAGAIATGTQITAAYIAVFVAVPAMWAGATAAVNAYILARAAATAADEMGIAKSVASMGALQAAAGLLFAAFAGWQIGTYLRENFLEAELAGIAFVEGTLVAYQRLRQGVLIVWEGIKAAGVGAINAIRERLADMLGGLAELAGVEVFGEKLLGGTADSMRQLEQAIRPAKSAAVEFQDALAGINAEAETNIAIIRESTGDMAGMAIAQSSAAESSNALADASGDAAGQVDDLNGALADFDPAAKNAKDGADDVTRAFREMNQAASDAEGDLDRLLDNMAAQLGGPSVSAALEYRDALVGVANAEAAILALGPPTLENQARIDEARRMAGENYQNAVAGIEQNNRRELTETERVQLNVIDAMSGAIGDFAARNIKTWRDLFGAFRDIAKQALADIVSTFLRQRLMLSVGMTGGSGSALASGGPDVSSLASGGNLLGGITQGGGLIGGINSGTFGAVGGMLAGIGGAVGAFGAGMTVAGSAGLVAASQFGVASLAAGNLAVGMGALVPVIGWIVAAVAAVNAIAGGRLLGTSYRAESATSTLALGADGGDASQSIREVRQRALFGGRQWRNRSVDASDEAVQAAAQLFDAVRQVMTGAATALEGEAPEMIAAALRTVQEFDKKGKVTATRYFVDVLGRSWEEATAEAAATRISAEALVATIDSILGTTTDAAAQSAAAAGADVVTAAAEGAGGVLGTVGDLIVKSAQGAIGEASAIAERWRDDAAVLMDGAQMLLAAAVDMRAGAGLLGEGGTLTDIANLVEELANDGESLVQSYGRVTASTRMLEEALALSGVTTDKTREELVRFAVDITEAAGGLDRAQALWSRYFQTFFTEAERLQYAISQADQRAAGQFGDIGLDLGDFTGDTGAADFRALFEQMLPTLSAEAVVQWLEAADALGVLIDLSGQAGDAVGGLNTSLADLMAGVASQLEELAPPQSFAERMAAIKTEIDDLITRATALGASEADLAQIRELGARRFGQVLEEQAAAIADYQAIVQGVRDELADAAGLSDFQQEMRGINRWLAQTTDSMNQAAIAAGMQGAAEQDLAAAHELAAIRAAEAIRRLEERGRSVVQELYGSPLEQLQQQIAAIESGIGSFSSGVSGGMGDVEQAANGAIQAQLGAQQRIQDWLDNLLLGELGGLRPRDALVEAQALFDSTLAAALGGDAEAMAALPGLADQLLRLGQQVYASGAPYFDLRDAIRDGLEQVAGLVIADPGGGGGGSGSAGGGGGGSGSVGGGGGGELYAERDRLLAEQAAAERRELALELAGIVRDLVLATGAPLEEIAAQLGFTMAALVEDLGVNLDDLTLATAGQLGDIAQAMGTELTELAAAVGVELGALADRQSLLNDALEAEIAGLPQGQRDLLEPLLRDVEEAAALGDTAGVESGIADMEAAINEMAPDIRDALAPYFAGVAPASAFTELDRLANIDTTLADSLAAHDQTNYLLGEIWAVIDNMGNLAPGGSLPAPGPIAPGTLPPPSYAVGTTYVPRDGLAMIHQGEAVIPANVNQFLTNWLGVRPSPRIRPGPIGGGGGPRDDLLVRELQQLRQERLAADEYTRRLEDRLRALETTTASAARDSVAAMNRQTDAMRRTR